MEWYRACPEQYKKGLRFTKVRFSCKNGHSFEMLVADAELDDPGVGNGIAFADVTCHCGEVMTRLAVTQTYYNTEVLIPGSGEVEEVE